MYVFSLQLITIIMLLWLIWSQIWKWSFEKNCLKNAWLRMTENYPESFYHFYLQNIVVVPTLMICISSWKSTIGNLQTSIFSGFCYRYPAYNCFSPPFLRLQGIYNTNILKKSKRVLIKEKGTYSWGVFFA